MNRAKKKRKFHEYSLGEAIWIKTGENTDGWDIIECRAAGYNIPYQD